MKYDKNNIRRLMSRIGFLAVGLGLALIVGGTGAAQSVSNEARPKPVWPGNGIAQREFPNGSNMFVENDHGTWRIWVLELVNGDYVQALDFFSGECMRVKVKFSPDGEQDFAFTDAKGKFHTATDEGFHFTGPVAGDLNDVVFGRRALRFEGTNNSCDVTLGAVITCYQAADNRWSKFPIYRIAAVPTGCHSGNLDSLVDTALDLDDGTFLVTEGCYVFRLRKSDLSPVGSAPALRVVDESAVQAVIDQAKGKSIDDATGYLAKALNLPTDPKLSCKED
ncbi:hypothetical protein [Dyella psychrodurans]|uniref:Uncharacterized protein n=1 Tax=Dyella psychrodurans TaxID=1927960 RepID=A0A370WYE8_9GAMM|nr:hypothetical protein [Dyella psychrodurans]RDS81031.1 hypothetical protein DWU99_18450 [Dyella psychrodurans]